MVLDGELITTSITLGEVRVDSAGGVEGLMDITDIMNEESYSVRSAKGFGVSSVGHNCLVDIGVLIVSSLSEPVDDLGDHKGNVFGGENEIWVVANV